MEKRKRFQRVATKSEDGKTGRIKRTKPAEPPDLSTLPARMVYSPTGIIPATVASPDHEPPVLVPWHGSRYCRRTRNGLTAKADAMARWIAHGATASDAFRSAYGADDVASHHVARRANTVMRAEGFDATVAQYADAIAEKRRQARISVADYVKSRLVIESQDATNDGARVQSLKLLGMTEGLFTTVHRNEKAIAPHDLQALKNKLDQRVREVLARVSGPIHGPERLVPPAETGVSDPDHARSPLVSARDSSIEKNAIPSIRSVTFSDHPSPTEGPGAISAGGSSATESQDFSGYDADFEGPLVLNAFAKVA